MTDEEQIQMFDNIENILLDMLMEGNDILEINVKIKDRFNKKQTVTIYKSN